jgi:predicted DNA-binding transcriptional regulator YafY
MQHKEAYIRYKLIHRQLKNKQHPYPTMDDFRRMLEEHLGKPFSVSTVQKDIKTMKEDEELGFLAPIKFSRSHNGYYYSEPFELDQISFDDPELEALKIALSFLEPIATTSIGKSYLSVLNKIYKSMCIDKKAGKYDRHFIITENKPDHSGLQVFDHFVDSIQDKYPVKVLHYSFQHQESKHLILHPYVLKEYRNQWYVVGFSELHNEVRTFGLNRILNISHEKKTKYRDAGTFDPQLYFNDCIGITRKPNGTKETIRLQFNTKLSPYINAQPIHSSQRVITELSKYVVEIDVFITVELISLLMSYGKNVKVISPAWLNEDIKRNHRLAAGDISAKPVVKV